MLCFFWILTDANVIQNQHSSKWCRFRAGLCVVGGPGSRLPLSAFALLTLTFLGVSRCCSVVDFPDLALLQVGTIALCFTEATGVIAR
jgi:hypothetical protein